MPGLAQLIIGSSIEVSDLNEVVDDSTDMDGYLARND